MGLTWLVAFSGAPDCRRKTAWSKIAADFDLCWKPTLHTLKHTAITWVPHNGTTVWDYARYFATSVETIQKVYGHYETDYMKSALWAVEKRKK